MHIRLVKSYRKCSPIRLTIIVPFSVMDATKQSMDKAALRKILNVVR